MVRLQLETDGLSSIEFVQQLATKLSKIDNVTVEIYTESLFSFSPFPSVIKEPIENVEENEEALIRRALKEYDYNMSETARRLGIGRTTLYRKLKKYLISIERDI